MVDPLADALEDSSLREAALDYIRADYLRTHAWTKTRLCVVLGHPEKFPPGMEPKFYEPGCPCGKRREPATSTAQLDMADRLGRKAP